MEDSWRFYDDYMDNSWKICGESIVYICIYNGKLMDNLCAMYGEFIEVYQLEFIVLKNNKRMICGETMEIQWIIYGRFVLVWWKDYGRLMENWWRICADYVEI